MNEEGDPPVSDGDSEPEAAIPKPVLEEKPSCLVPELLSEFMKVSAARTEITLMAKIRALAQVNEDRRAPVTICAAIDRR